MDFKVEFLVHCRYLNEEWEWPSNWTEPQTVEIEADNESEAKTKALIVAQGVFTDQHIVSRGHQLVGISRLPFRISRLP